MARIDLTVHATYRDFPAPEPGRDLVLLDTREVEGGGSWCGHIVGTTYQFTTNGNLQTLEGDPRFFFDDSQSPQCQGTGSEEWGGGGDYWGGRTMTLPFAGHPVGRPPNQAKTALDRIHSAYRFLLTDLMPFGRNARVTLEHGGQNESSEHYETVTYWYGVNAAGLILTDELDVGNLTDEKAHGYSSPDASEPERLASRFELGVDHIPIGGGGSEIFQEIVDDGRHTKSSSEFTLKLATNNLGVLVRRRLDLNYPKEGRKNINLIACLHHQPVAKRNGMTSESGIRPEAIRRCSVIRSACRKTKSKVIRKWRRPRTSSGARIVVGGRRNSWCRGTSPMGVGQFAFAWSFSRSACRCFPGIPSPKRHGLNSATGSIVL